MIPKKSLAKNNTNLESSSWFVLFRCGAQGRTRTGTVLPPKDFKSFASAVPPLGQILEAPPRLELGVKALQASALPLGYGAVISIYAVTRAGVQKNGGSYRARTCDPLLVRQMLSQLS